jgi:hypothetical protein
MDDPVIAEIVARLAHDPQHWQHVREALVEIMERNVEENRQTEIIIALVDRQIEKNAKLN